MSGSKLRLARSVGILLAALSVAAPGAAAKTCAPASAGASSAQELVLKPSQDLRCTTAARIARDFWLKRGRTRRAGSSDATTYFTLRAWKGWRCVSLESGGVCRRGAKRVSFAVRDLPLPPAPADAPAVGGTPARGAADTAELLAGIPQQGLELGQPDAPMTIVEFIDLQCPFCAQFQLDDQPAVVRDLVRTGKAKLRMAPLELGFMGEDSAAARTVAVRLAAKHRAWDFVDLFARNQGKEQTGYVTDRFLLGLAAAIPGATRGDIVRTPGPGERALLGEIDRLAIRLEVTGTPSFAVGPSNRNADTYRLVELAGEQTAAAALAAAVASGT